MSQSIATLKFAFFIAIYNKANKTITMRDGSYDSWDAAEDVADSLDDDFDSKGGNEWTQVIKINVNSPHWNKEKHVKILNDEYKWRVSTTGPHRL